ncbi:unnamed protein product [marine sediment metagenome]|uniref:Uncharacterized protein n=1 Tax=marine sediment metagenome TaxID=412755 RepID=X1EV25_9ZZZZ
MLVHSIIMKKNDKIIIRMERDLKDQLFLASEKTGETVSSLIRAKVCEIVEDNKSKENIPEEV